MGDLSANFDRSEFRCPHCKRLVGPAQGLVDALQRLRTAKGAALHIVSGYRCSAQNRAVGGWVRSHHMTGHAVDIPGSYASVGAVRAAGFTGAGIRRGRVVHVEWVPGNAWRTFPD